MWLFKQVGDRYHVGYLTQEQRVNNGRPMEQENANIEATEASLGG